MKIFPLFAALFFVSAQALFVAPVAAQSRNLEAETKNISDELAAKGLSGNKPEHLEKFRDQALGLFIHWSVDGQLGPVISHNLVGSDKAYADKFFNELPTTFNPVKYDPAEWANLAKLCGFRYAVFTAKHHSGFCMYPTKTTGFSIANTPYKKDITGMYADAFRKAGLGMGLYFSPDDFWMLHKQGRTIARLTKESLPSNNPELMRHNLEQIRELYSNYGAVEYLFIDGEPDGIRDLAWKLQPDTLVTRGALATPEQGLPKNASKDIWEACLTLGTEWNFRPTNEVYKSGAKVIEMLIETRAKGGNLLLNVGPDPSGAIPFEQERILRELGMWLFINGEAIYKVRPWHTVREGGIWFTRSASEPDTVYAFLTDAADWKRGKRRNFVIKSLKATDKTAVSVLGHDGKTLEYALNADATHKFSQKADGLHLDIIRAQRIYDTTAGQNILVVKLTHVEPVTVSPDADKAPAKE